MRHRCRRTFHHRRRTWMQELIDEMNKIASKPMPDDEYEKLRPKIAPEHESIESRAHAYSDSVHDWLEARNCGSQESPTDPRAVIAWFQYSIPAKIHRAIHGLACDDPTERDWPADHDGSAKVALLGIERSHAAWLEIVRSRSCVAGRGRAIHRRSDLAERRARASVPTGARIRAPGPRRTRRSRETAGIGGRPVLSACIYDYL